VVSGAVRWVVEMKDDLRAALEDALGVQPWKRWERELDWFAARVFGSVSAEVPPDARWAIEAELRQLLSEPEALKIVAEAGRILRHQALRELVWEEADSIQKPAIVRSELERLEISVPQGTGRKPLIEIAQQETAQRLGYWWGKLRKLETAA
jgi:hypothetical protein